MISIEAYCASIGKFYNWFFIASAQSIFFISSSFCYACIFRCYICRYYYMFLFCIIGIVYAFDVAYVNSVWFKNNDCSWHYLELNYRGLNLNFLKLAQILIDGDIESNPGPPKKYPNGCSKNVKVSIGTPKMCDFIENINFIVASSDLKIQNSFWNQPVNLNIIKPWSVTCPSTMESTQKMEFK